MKIALIIPSLRFGLRYWRNLALALEQEGLAVIILTAVPPDTVPDDLRVVATGGRLLGTGQHSPNYGKVILLPSPRLAWEIWRVSPDLVMAVEYSLATFFAYLGARLSGARFVVFQEHKSKNMFIAGKAKRQWRKFISNLADMLIANTEAALNEIAQLYPRAAAKTKVIPLLVPPAVSDLKKKPFTTPKPKSRPVFAYVGQLISRKNVKTLIEAAYLLDRQRLDFDIWLVGDGPEKDMLYQLVESKGLNEKVRFLGKVDYDSLGYVYEQVDALIMPTFADYRSVVVLEALRFGKPVVLSCEDGNAGDTIKDGVNGVIFNPRNKEELAGIMANLISDSFKLRKLTEGAKMTTIPTPSEAARLFRESFSVDSENVDRA